MTGSADFWRRFRRNRAAVGGLFVLALVVGAAIAGPLIYPVDPFDMIGRPSLPPSARYPLGTDVSGRDILAGLLHGGRVSVAAGLLAGDRKAAARERIVEAAGQRTEADDGELGGGGERTADERTEGEDERRVRRERPVRRRARKRRDHEPRPGTTAARP